MKSIIATVVTAAGLIISGSTWAVDLPAVGKAKCGACHTVDKKLVGPAFKDVSAKYKGDKDAIKTITAHINSGGEFGWKLGKMPAKGLGGMATDADIKTMAEFIVGLAK